jgi:peptidoglycan/LPS O-acetylase OafA/YrhL
MADGEGITSSATTSARRGVAHIASLDGLRAAAVAVVFLGHGLPPPFPGELGVTVFFFLSGYLITTLLRAEFERTGSISLRAFYARRVLRIFPPFYLALIGSTTLAAFGALGPARLDAPTLLSQAAYLSNYDIVAGEWIPGLPWGGAPGTGVYWSLAVEEHFYLFFPVLYVALQRRLRSRRQQAAVLLGICALVLLWRAFLVYGLQSGKDRTYVATDTRIDSILFGCVLGVVGNPALDETPGRAATWKAVLLPLGVLGILFGLGIRDQRFHESLRYTMQGLCLVPVFVVAVRYPNWGPMRALNWRWVRLLGVLSYSMYLVHLTVLSGLDARVHAPLLVRTAAGAVITIALAYAIHLLVERPLVRWRRRLSRLHASGEGTGTRALTSSTA